MSNNSKAFSQSKASAFSFRTTAIADAFALAGVAGFSFKNGSGESKSVRPVLIREPLQEGILRARSDKHNNMPSIKISPLAFA